MNRRGFIGTLLAGLAGSTLPKIGNTDEYCQGEEQLSLVERIKQLMYERNSDYDQDIDFINKYDIFELDTIAEFSEFYIENILPRQKYQTTVNILYPGAGEDYKQLLIALKVLHESDVEQVNMVYTEIGREQPKWRKAVPLSDIMEVGSMRVVDEITKYGKNIEVNGKTKKLTHVSLKHFHDLYKERKLCRIVNRTMEFEVDTRQGPKKLTWSYSINNSPNRPELKEEEKEYFTDEYMKKVREGLWPFETKGKYHPQYATDEQFQEADIILSRKCGDTKLLDLDYLRALLNFDNPKLKTIFTQDTRNSYSLKNQVPGYESHMHELRNGYYGDTRVLGKWHDKSMIKQGKAPERVGALIFEPK